MVGSSMFKLHGPKILESCLQSQVQMLRPMSRGAKHWMFFCLATRGLLRVDMQVVCHKPMISDAYEAGIVHGFWSTPRCQQWGWQFQYGWVEVKSSSPEHSRGMTVVDFSCFCIGLMKSNLAGNNTHKSERKQCWCILMAEYYKNKVKEQPQSQSHDVVSENVIINYSGSHASKHYMLGIHFIWLKSQIMGTFKIFVFGV